MGLYADRILPRLIAWAMRTEELTPYRERLIPQARGLVLEVGVGSGLNLPLYGPQVERVVGLDPSAALLRRAAALAARATCPIHLLRATAAAIPLAPASLDTVVMTWTLCSLPDARAGLREMRRVLRPDGQLLFVEHGLAPEPGIAAWQHRLDPLWWRVSCHLDNPVPQLLAEAGFGALELRSGYLGAGPKVVTYMTEGVARPR
ncbi:class I SAM-dependent methyltransferase [Roseicella aquatilis]|uniref:Class I SAM-dependent methyltransferase n=1 Tax=Roseicella aquatilis TaxID=2527868 RepID=A0A4R4DB92_9PROT|nr:class I SAM-dependent methyltransferase [Roseicella aquatilis]TCZ57306.1 class I SAM-dependent methyltransferase [Roseicella aquatilis]